MFRSLVPWTLVLVGCAGTDPIDGGQYGEENGAHCAAQSRTALAADETSSLGFAPQALLDLVGAPETVTLGWADGTTTDLSIEVVADGAMELVDYEIEVDEDGTRTAMTEMGCADLVEIEVSFRFSTADGAFDEQVSTRLVSADGLQASLTHDLDAVQGTFDAWDFAPEGNDWDDLRAWIDATWSEAGASGVVQGQGSGTDGEVAFAESLQIGTWGTAAE